METIGQRIAKLRDIKAEECDHCTQQDLADAMGVEKGTIYKWEHDLVCMNSDKIVALSEYFHVSCDYILRGGTPDHLELMNTTGLSHEAITILSDQQFKTNYMSTMINVLVFHPVLLFILHEYVFGDFPEEDNSKLIPSQERITRLAVLDQIKKLREVVQNGES